MRNSYNTDNTAVGTEPAYNKYGHHHGTSDAAYEATAPTATHRHHHDVVGTGVGATDGAYTNTYADPTTAYPNTGYETGTGETYDREVPARQYAGHSVHNPAANY